MQEAEEDEGRQVSRLRREPGWRGLTRFPGKVQPERAVELISEQRDTAGETSRETE